MRLEDKHWFTRVLEIIPGFLAWSMLLAPFILAPIFPELVAYFVLAFTFYWFIKALNVMRNLLRGFPQIMRNMKVDWLERVKLATDDPKRLLDTLEKNYEKSRKKVDYKDYEEIANLNGDYQLIKDWKEIYHVVVIANYGEDVSILRPTLDALLSANYPNKKFIVVLAGEKREEKEYVARKKILEKEYAEKFDSFLFYLHEDQVGEVKGKGSNIYSAGKKLKIYLEKERSEINPENILVTTLDADHIVHREYFARLTYRYIVDPSREHKTYQPVALLFNNIWDAPAPNRIAAVSSSFWQIVEAVRPFRQRTFAAHAQSLKTLLVTDFWSNQTIVEDGHQYWRTYFAYNGDIEMDSLLIPVYQDCVMAEKFSVTMKNQYLQLRRWSWGISDFPFVVKNYMKHPEISLGEKALQIFRLFGGHFSWSTASFLIAFAWLPLLFNENFQDTVLAQNLGYYNSILLNLTWICLIGNVWAYFSLLPPKPEHHQKTRYIGMILQWILAPFVAIVLSAAPALESQTRLMIGKYLDVFWTTPKVRKSSVAKHN